MLEIQDISVDPSFINRLYKNKSIKYQDFSEHEMTEWDKCDSSFYLLRVESTGQSALVLWWGESVLELVETKGVSFKGTVPRDAPQSCLFHSLRNRRLTVVLGEAGTGKTTIALAYALECLFKRDMNVILCKPTVFVGQRSNAMAPIPGDHREKMSGYIDSYLTSMQRILGDTFEHHLYELEEDGRIKFQPLELIRGQHFEKSVVIIDEAQNTSPHELMSTISRLDETSVCIVLGDPCQIDRGVVFSETGLGALVESQAFEYSDISAGVRLTTNYRGPLAILASDVLRELSERQ